MRTREQERARWTGLTPREFGEQTGQSEASVRGLIRDGWFEWVDGRPECIDVRRVGGQRAEYRINPSAVDRWFKVRAATEKRSRKAPEAA